MKLSKAFKKNVVIFTVLLFFVILNINVYSYIYDDVTVNNKIYIPPLPLSEITGYNYFIACSSEYGILLVCYDAPIYFREYSSRYVFFSSSYCSYKSYVINENWEWEILGIDTLRPNQTYVYLNDVFKFSDWNVRYSDVDLLNYNDDVIYTSNSIYENFVIVNSYDEIPFPSDAPDYDSWFSSVFDAITDWFGGVLEVLATPFTAIADGLNGVWLEIKNIPQLIADKLEYLFVPSGDKFDELKDKFDEKFGFVGQIIDLGQTIINATFGGSKPNSNITIYGGTYTIIDWDIYDNYRTYIHGIIVLLSYIVFIPKLIKRLPSVVRGI